MLFETKIILYATTQFYKEMLNGLLKMIFRGFTSIDFAFGIRMILTASIGFDSLFLTIVSISIAYPLLSSICLTMISMLTVLSPATVF